MVVVVMVNDEERMEELWSCGRTAHRMTGIYPGGVSNYNYV